MMIEVKDLTVIFGDSTAVKNTSFGVDEGESFGLVGESGSGKSTILRTIMGAIPPDADRRRVAVMLINAGLYLLRQSHKAETPPKRVP